MKISKPFFWTSVLIAVVGIVTLFGTKSPVSGAVMLFAGIAGMAVATLMALMHHQASLSRRPTTLPAFARVRSKKAK